MCGFWKATTAAVGPPIQQQELALGLGIGITASQKNSPAVEANRRVLWLISGQPSGAKPPAELHYKTRGLHTNIASTNAANVADGNLAAVGLVSRAIEAQLLDRVEHCFGERAHGDV